VIDVTRNLKARVEKLSASRMEDSPLCHPPFQLPLPNTCGLDGHSNECADDSRLDSQSLLDEFQEGERNGDMIL
jgi:hypothetical protein